MHGGEVVIDTGGGDLMIVLAWLLAFVRLLLVVVLLLLLALGLVLALPFHYRLAAGAGKDGWHLRSTVRWAWGLAVIDAEIIDGRSRFQTRVLGRLLKGAKARVKAKAPSSQPASSAPKRADRTNSHAQPISGRANGSTRQASSKPRRSIEELRRYLSQPVLKATVRLLRRLYVSLHLEAIIVRGVYGFEDPAQTGLVAAWGHSLGGALPFLRWRMVPVFDGPTFDLELELLGWLSPSALIVWAAEFGLGSAVRPLWFGQVFGRFRKKQRKGSGAHGTERVSRDSDERPRQDAVVRERSRGTDHGGTGDDRPSGHGLLRVRDRRRRGEG